MEHFRTFVAAHEFAAIRAHRTPIFVRIIFVIQFVCGKFVLSDIEKIAFIFLPSLEGVEYVELCTGGEFVFPRAVSGNT